MCSRFFSTYFSIKIKISSFLLQFKFFNSCCQDTAALVGRPCSKQHFKMGNVRASRLANQRTPGSHHEKGVAWRPRGGAIPMTFRVGEDLRATPLRSRRPVSGSVAVVTRNDHRYTFTSAKSMGETPSKWHRARV